MASLLWIWGPCLFFKSFLFFIFLYFFFFFFYCSGFCHTLKWNSHGFTCVPHPDPPSHLPLHPIPLGLPSAPGPSVCLPGESPWPEEPGGLLSVGLQRVAHDWAAKPMTPTAVEQKSSAGKQRSFPGTGPGPPRKCKPGVNTWMESRGASAVCPLQMPSPLSGPCMDILGPLWFIFQVREATLS